MVHSRWPHNRNKLAAGYFKTDSVKRVKISNAAFVSLGYIFNFNHLEILMAPLPPVLVPPDDPKILGADWAGVWLAEAAMVLTTI